MTDQVEEPATKRAKTEDNETVPVATAAAPAVAAATAVPIKKPNPATGALQQQIQAQLQQQLQAQLQAAAARGQQANITPEQIQAQAQAMVQAAAQAQAVVSAAKSRGDGLVPMNAQQIAALSQIQAQAIVNARPQTALLASGGPTTDKDGKPIQPTQAQIQHQITLQAQALVHAHTQAQIAAGIYKGDGSVKGATKPAASTATKPSTTTAMSSTSTESVTTPLTPNQLAQQTNLSSRHDSTKKEMIQKHESQLMNLRSQFQQANLAAAPSEETQSEQESQIKTMIDRHKQELANLEKSMQVEMAELQAEFRKQNSAVDATGQKSVALSGAAVNRTAVPSKLVTSVASTPANIALSTSLLNDEPVASSTSPVFLEKLSNTLNQFWTEQLQQMRELGTVIPQTEQDFKNHNDLPLARIKRIMKSDEDVRMISAEAPVLFAKACEMFILELTLRSWSYSENNKRRTLQKEDIREAIQRTDIFDFLVDLPNSTM